MNDSNMKQKVQARFGEVAANYRVSAVHASGPDLEVMVRSADLKPHHTVLDAGCGAGHAALAFAGPVARVIACDFTPTMLRQVEVLARDRHIDNVIPLLTDIEDLPFPDNSIDLVVSRYSAHHWSHPERALTEFRRALKDDGLFIISDIMASEDYGQDTFLQAIELLRDPSHVRDYRISEWRSMMTAAGFLPELTHTFALELHFATWTARMHTPRQNISMIKTMFADAPQDIRRAFRLPQRIDDEKFSFFIPGAVIKCQPKS